MMCCETLLDVYLRAGKYRLFDVIVPCLGSTVVVDSHSAAVCPSRTLGSVDTNGMQVARTGKFFLPLPCGPASCATESDLVRFSH